MIVPQGEKSITSLELLKEINKFRKLDISKKDLAHKSLLSVIRDEFEEEINGKNILPVSYLDKKGESRPMFVLTINQAKQVLVRESKIVRKAVIKRLDELEGAGKSKLPSTYIEALEQLVRSEKEKENLLIEAKENKPKIDFFKAVNEADGLLLVREYAKLISENGFCIGEKKLYQWLRNNKYLTAKNEPYQKYIQMGIFEVKERIINRTNLNFAARVTMITCKGQTYLFNKLRNLFEGL
jgi:phage antirepressor YoqD-like protein